MTFYSFVRLPLGQPSTPRTLGPTATAMGPTWAGGGNTTARKARRGNHLDFGTTYMALIAAMPPREAHIAIMLLAIAVGR